MGLKREEIRKDVSVWQTGMLKPKSYGLIDSTFVESNIGWNSVTISAALTSFQTLDLRTQARLLLCPKPRRHCTQGPPPPRGRQQQHSPDFPHFQPPHQVPDTPDIPACVSPLHADPLILTLVTLHIRARDPIFDANFSEVKYAHVRRVLCVLVSIWGRVCGRWYR